MHGGLICITFCLSVICTRRKIRLEIKDALIVFFFLSFMFKVNVTWVNFKEKVQTKTGGHDNLKLLHFKYPVLIVKIGSADIKHITKNHFFAVCFLGDTGLPA